MRIACLAVFLFLTSLYAIAGALQPPAFFNPRVEPAQPSRNDDVVWIAQWDGCGALGPTTITRAGDRIEVQYLIERVCGVPIGPVYGSVHLGQFQPGRYVVRVSPCDGGFNGFDPNNCTPVEPSPDVTFVVGGTTPTAIPAPSLATWSLTALAIALALLGWISLRLRARKP
jgi:hypothetical protein